MGADGRWVIESRARNSPGPSNAWEGVAQSNYPCMSRDYRLFGLLNDTRPREGYDCLFEPRGFPEGNPYSLAREIFKGADTGATWLTTAEAMQVSEAYAAKDGEHSLEWDAVVAFMRSLEAAGEECRVLFATDQG